MMTPCSDSPPPLPLVTGRGVGRSHAGEADDEETRLRALRERLLARFPTRPAVYWIDLSCTAAIGWGSFIGAVRAPPWSAAQTFLAFVAALALLRGGFFIHEVAHQKKSLPGFEFAWNALFGVPLLMPSFMMSGHGDHHRTATFGTALDPEYEPLGRASPAAIALGVAVMILVGPALALRALILAPLSIALLALRFPSPRQAARARSFVVERLSSLVTNERYSNPHLPDNARMRALELGCTALAWCVIALCVCGVLPWALPLMWLAVFGIGAAINQARTQVAHGYESEGAPMTLAAQVADSATVAGAFWNTGLLYPLGTRFHALHHLAPTLPYHSMPAAHRWLVAQLSGPTDGTRNSSYLALSSRGHTAARLRLWRRALLLRAGRRSRTVRATIPCDVSTPAVCRHPGR